MSDEAQATPSARRCSICALSFPNDPKWAKCAQCGEPTSIIGNAAPNITDEAATMMLRAREFQEYLEKEGIE
jgi:hypothetical protein